MTFRSLHEVQNLKSETDTFNYIRAIFDNPQSFIVMCALGFTIDDTKLALQKIETFYQAYSLGLSTKSIRSALQDSEAFQTNFEKLNNLKQQMKDSMGSSLSDLSACQHSSARRQLLESSFQYSMSSQDSSAKTALETSLKSFGSSSEAKCVRTSLLGCYVYLYLGELS